MNKFLTEIIALVDESGSMGSIRGDTIGGINSFIDDQKKLADGKAKFTLVTFSYANRIKKVIDGVDIQEVEHITEADYRPGGGTALLDAIGKTIDELEDKYTNEEDESKVPSQVIFAIVTDGQENSSREYQKEQISKMIKHQTKRHNWEFAFLGANLDAVEEARSIGIEQGRSFNFAANSKGIADSFGVLSNATAMYRSSGVASYDLSGTSLEGMNSGSSLGGPDMTITGGTIKASDIHVNISAGSPVDADKLVESVKDAIEKASKNSNGA